MKSICSIFKKQGNQKGFSLVELLIVIAIMGVLAVIAFNAFNGVLINSKKRADDQQAKVIEKAIRVLITDTGKVKLLTLMNSKRTFYFTSAAAATSSADAENIIGAVTTNQDKVRKLIEALQKTIYVKDAQAVVRQYGPYLTVQNANNTIAYDNFKPQWNLDDGSGEHVGYNIKIFTKNQNVNVVPTTVAADETIVEDNTN